MEPPPAPQVPRSAARPRPGSTTTAPGSQARGNHLTPALFPTAPPSPPRAHPPPSPTPGGPRARRPPPAHPPAPSAHRASTADRVNPLISYTYRLTPPARRHGTPHALRRDVAPSL